MGVAAEVAEVPEGAAVAEEALEEGRVRLAVAMAEAVAMGTVAGWATATDMVSATQALAIRFQATVPIPKTLEIREQPTMDGLFQPTVARAT